MKKFAEIWDDIREKKYKNEYIKEINNNMPSKKRTVKYEENVDSGTGDKSVEVSDEQSINDDQPEVEESNTDERYNAASGN